MTLFNRKKRTRYLGFDDTWFTIIGILILSFITDYLFNKSFLRFPFFEAVIYWSNSLLFTICDWLIIRSVLIQLRKRYPDFKHDRKRILLLLFLIVLTVVVVDFVGGNFLVVLFGWFGEQVHHQSQLRVLLPVTIITVMTMAMYEAIYYYVRLKKSIREEEQTKQIMIQAQLDTLTNQARPHFLFNSLNTLRDIIDQESKEDAKGFVDQLSNVYRFILESGKTNLITIEKELEFAQAYVYIQSERFGENLKINWKISEDKMSSMIVPMSLQLLIENAIKHNVVSKTKPLIVDIEVKDHHLVVRNKIQKKSTKTPSTKIGLKNIEKRYRLISDQLPKIQNDGSEFIVSLPLLTSLTKNVSYANTHH